MVTDGLAASTLPAHYDGRYQREPPPDRGSAQRRVLDPLSTRDHDVAVPAARDTPISANHSGSGRAGGQGWGTCSATSNSSRLAAVETGGRGLSPGAVAWAARDGPAAHAWYASSLSHFV